MEKRGPQSGRQCTPRDGARVHFQTPESRRVGVQPGAVFPGPHSRGAVRAECRTGGPGPKGGLSFIK